MDEQSHAHRARDRPFFTWSPHSRVPGDGCRSQKMHYTKTLPPPQLLDEVPNWYFDTSRETRPGCDTYTLYPHRKSDCIHDEVNVTVGDVWLPSGETRVALMLIDDEQVSQIFVYEIEGYWLIDEKTKIDQNLIREKVWSTDAYSQYDNRLPISFENKDIFPLRFCTRLAGKNKRRALSGMIDTLGKASPWNIDELWTSLNVRGGKT